MSILSLYTDLQLQSQKKYTEGESIMHMNCHVQCHVSCNDESKSAAYLNPFFLTHSFIKDDYYYFILKGVELELTE
jgi:hypothetical protein